MEKEDDTKDQPSHIWFNLPLWFHSRIFSNEYFRQNQLNINIFAKNRKTGLSRTESSSCFPAYRVYIYLSRYDTPDYVFAVKIFLTDGCCKLYKYITIDVQWYNDMTWYTVTEWPRVRNAGRNKIPSFLQAAQPSRTAEFTTFIFIVGFVFINLYFFGV